MSNQIVVNSIEKAFQDRKSPLFIPFITAGDPTPEATIEICLALQEAGADIIELGVPYSDPLADGPTIQRASGRALQQGVSIASCIELGAEMRKRGLMVPLILFTYVNPVLQYGFPQLVEKIKEAGFDGLLVPDLPIEESRELKDLADAAQLPLISLVAPTSKQRIEKIAKQANGFIYCVSSLGVTGTRQELSEGVSTFLDEVKAHASVPIAVGFGISNKEQVDQLSPHCDGIIVGSAIVQLIEGLGEDLKNDSRRPMALEQIKRFVQTLLSGVR